MPSTLIEVRRAYTPDEQVALMNAVHSALVEAFRIPEDDRFMRFVEFPPHAMVNGLHDGVADTYLRVTIRAELAPVLRESPARETQQVCRPAA